MCGVGSFLLPLHRQIPGTEFGSSAKHFTYLLDHLIGPSLVGWLVDLSLRQGLIAVFEMGPCYIV